MPERLWDPGIISLVLSQIDANTVVVDSISLFVFRDSSESVLLVDLGASPSRFGEKFNFGTLFQ